MRGTWSLATCLSTLMLVLAAGPSLARPEYAEKEKRECAYCHVNPAGGGERNARGKHYASHGYSLKGLPVEFKLLWKLSAPAETRRAALGDVLGTKKPQVLLLGAGEELTVREVSGDELTQKASVKLGPKASSFVVGNLQKEKAAIIAVPGALFHWTGQDFEQTKAPALSAISGTVRFVEGEECVFHFDGMNEPTVFSVKLGEQNPLVVGPSMVLPDQGSGVYSWVVARFPADAVAALGWPAEVSKSPAVGLWDARDDKKLMAWAVWTDTKGSRLVLVDPGTLMYGGSLKPTWSSEPFEGKVLDVTLGLDPKDGKVPGFLVLTAGGSDEKTRTLYFLGLE